MQLTPALVFYSSSALPLLSQLALHIRRETVLRPCLHDCRGSIHTGAGPLQTTATDQARPAAQPGTHSPRTHLLSALFGFNAPDKHLSTATPTTVTLIHSLSRRYATSSSSSSSGSGASGGGPHELLASKCRVLPFGLGRDEADHEWCRHHEGFFTSQPSSATSVKASLLPFWCIGTEAQVAVHSAQIGRDYVASRYNPLTRRYEPRWETSWTTVVPNWRYSRRWSAESEETQVYGGSKYRNDPALGRMKPGEYVRQALTYSDYVRRTQGEQPERMVPFRLGPTEAVEAARQAIRQAELRNAEQQLLQTYGGDRVRLVAMDVQMAGLTATPVFSPVYVFKTRTRGTATRTYIAGFRTGLTSGPVFPNAVRVAATAAAVAPLALAATGALGGASWTTALLAGVALPYLLSYGLASFWPEMHANFLRLRARLQRPLPDAAQEEQERWWRYEWVRQDTDDSQGSSYSDATNESRSSRRTSGFGFGGFPGFGGFSGFPGFDQTGGGAQGAGQGAGTGGGYGRQQQQQQQQAGGGSGPRAAGGSDPKGYYRTLGVSPGSSTEDIQAAFRAAALKWHPDRQPNPSLKAEATQKFQAAQQAYSVLRDANRRAAYDRGYV